MQLPQGQLAQTIQAVAGVVLGGAHRQDPQLRARLRIQQEDDPVDVAQRLQGQVLCPLLGQRLQPPRGATAHHLIRKDLNRGAHALTQILRDPHRVGRRVLQSGRPPRLALRRRQQRAGIQAGQGPLHLAAARGLMTLDDELHVHRQPAALRPPLPLRHQRPLARQDQGEGRAVTIRHERRQCPGDRRDRLSPLQRRGVGVPQVHGLPLLSERGGVLDQQVLHRGHRAGAQQRQRRRALITHRPHQGHRAPLSQAVLRRREAQNLAQERIELVGRLQGRAGQGISVVGGKGRQQLLQAGTLGTEPGTGRRRRGSAGIGRLLQGLPLLATLQHARQEGLLGGVGREVVLADPVLADDQRIRHRHQRSPSISKSCGTTTSSGRTSVCAGKCCFLSSCS